MKNKLTLIYLCILSSVMLGSCTGKKAYDYDIIPLADPYILLDNGTYYAYGTYAADGIAYFTSKNLKDWEYGGLALSKENTSEDRWFWAPEVYNKNGKYYMYYSANEHLYVATSDSPCGPFVQHGSYLMDSIIGDEKCIDSSIFFDEDGKAYCFFVRFTDGNCIWMCEMNKDLVSPVPNTLHLCINVTEPWENKLGKVTEGPFIVKHNDTYYLTYSANDFRSQDYAVGYATSSDIMGEWTKAEENPIVHKVNGLVGTGHHSFFTDKRGKMRIVYHAHNSLEEVSPRNMYIGTMKWENGKLMFKEKQ